MEHSADNTHGCLQPTTRSGAAAVFSRRRSKADRRPGVFSESRRRAHFFHQKCKSGNTDFEIVIELIRTRGFVSVAKYCQNPNCSPQGSRLDSIQGLRTFGRGTDVGAEAPDGVSANDEPTGRRSDQHPRPQCRSPRTPFVHFISLFMVSRTS